MLRVNPNPPPPPPYAPHSEAPTSWWDRNKKWAIPVGCLGLVVILGCCGLLGFMGFGFSKLADFGKAQVGAIQAIQAEATQRVEASQELRAVVGEPITQGGVSNPNYRMVNGKVDYTFQIMVTGPKGSVTVEGRASAASPEERVTLRSLEFDDGTRNVELMDGPPPEDAMEEAMPDEAPAGDQPE